MKVQLWNFQDRANTEVLRLLDKGLRSILVTSPCGSGKTVMFEALAAGMLHNNARVLIATHRRKLVEQAYEEFAAIGVPAEKIGVIMANHPADGLRPNAPIQVASIQSLARRHYKLAWTPTVGIVDEAHHAKADTYLELKTRFPSSIHLGYTATPFRLDGRGLKDVYEHMVVAVLPSELIASGKLSIPKVYTAPERFMPDLEKLRIARGDYVIADLEERLDRTELVGNIYDNWKRRAEGKKTLGFALTIKSSKQYVDIFLKNGVSAAHIDGDMSVEEQKEIMDRFDRGEILVLFCCMLLVEGYDPQGVEAIILARPTNSLTLFLQQAGRGFRARAGEQIIILDHSRHIQRFGLPEADRRWVLTYDKLTKRQMNAGPTKQCPECETEIAVAYAECPHCHHQFRDLGIQIPAESNALLQEYDEQERQEFRQRIDAAVAAKRFPPHWAEDIVKIWSGYREQ